MSQRFCAKDVVSGCTAVTALVRGSSLHVAWLGDSECVLSRARACVSFMTPHKPNRPVRRPQQCQRDV